MHTRRIFLNNIIIVIIIIIYEFHGDTSLQTKLQGRSKCHVIMLNAAVVASVRCRILSAKQIEYKIKQIFGLLFCKAYDLICIFCFF